MTAAASPEVLLFASTTQSFLEKELPLSRVRELHEAGISFDRRWWRRAAELGWVSLLVPEELGGGSVSGNGVDDLALVAEQTGRTVAPGPLHPVSTVFAGLAEAQDGDRHADVIEALVSGEAVVSWAVYEPGRQWSPAAQADRDTYSKRVPHRRVSRTGSRPGAESDLLLVVADVDGSPAAVLGAHRRARGRGGDSALG